MKRYKKNCIIMPQRRDSVVETDFVDIVVGAFLALIFIGIIWGISSTMPFLPIWVILIIIGIIGIIIMWIFAHIRG